MTEEAKELVRVLGDGVWRETSIRFFAERDSRLRLGQRAPKGMQRVLNTLIEEKLEAAGWNGGSGYFFKGRTWARVTFRHQMSLGSDIVDALKVCKKERMELALILAASRATLDTISPNDAPALVSFEKLQSEIAGLDGVIDIPLVIGELTAATSAPQSIEDELRKKRPRDRMEPASL